MHKNIKLLHSSKKHRQYESIHIKSTILLQKTKHSLCPGNGVFAHEKCIIFVILYVFVFNNNNKKLSYCWETVRRESMPRIAEMDVEMTT